MTFNGHWTAYFDPETGQTVSAFAYDELLQTNGGYDVFAFFRNYQHSTSRDGQGNLCQPSYGGGWNVIAAFDPSAEEIRVRSYRIEDVDNDCTHDGVPASAADLQTDRSLPETILSYSFPDTRPAAFDNCSKMRRACDAILPEHVKRLTFALAPGLGVPCATSWVCARFGIDRAFSRCQRR